MSLQTRIKAAGAAAAAAPVDAGRRRAVKRRTKRAVMDRMGYDEVARISAYIDPALARSELRPAVEAALNVEEPTDLATSERETIIDEILDDVVGLGPLQPLIEDDTVTEIMINGCRSAFFERGGVLHPIEHAFEDDEQIRVLIDRIISPLGRRIDERSPIVNARLKTGYRVNAVIPPVAIDGPILTIRKFSDRICSLDELVGLGSLPLWYAQLLSCAVSLRQDLAVAGGTGSGKTTLLNVLGGLDHADTGELVINGTSTKDYSSADWDTYRNHHIGFIFQSFNLLPNLTVAENIILSMDASGKSFDKPKKAIVEELLEQVHLPKEYANERILHLSGGEQQRVVITRALSYGPSIIVADEPTGNLDPATQDDIMGIFRMLAHDEHRCVIIVTHSPEVAKTSDEVFELAPIKRRKR